MKKTGNNRWNANNRRDDPVKGIRSIEAEDIGKKRMSFCNGMYRGSNFALTRKGADLLIRCSIV